MPISKQLKKNTTWSILDLGIYPAMMIIATPIFIKYLGYEQYGIWMMVSTINQFIFVLNFGLGDSTIKIISGNRAIGNISHIVSSVNKNWSQAIIICLLSACIGLLIAFSGVVSYWFHIPNNLVYSTRIVLCIAFASAGIKFCEMVLLSIFKGYERFDLSSQLSLISRNSVVIINIILVIAGYSLPFIFMSIVVINLLNIIVQLIVLKKQFPIMEFLPTLTFKQRFTDKDQFWYWLQSVIGLIGFLSDKLLVGYFTNLKVLGMYSVASLIGNQLYNVLMSLGSFMFPRVAYERSVNNSFIQLYHNSRFVIAGMGWLLIFILLGSGSYIFSWWLGPDFYTGSIGYINLYLVFVAFMILNIIPYQFINASDSLAYNSLLEITLRLSHVIALLIGYYYNGVDGMLWGLIIATGINMVFQYCILYKVFAFNFSLWSSLSIVMPTLGIVLFVLNVSVILNIIACLFSMVTFFFFYYQSTNLVFWKQKK